jgi:hypothetical protein
MALERKPQTHELLGRCSGLPSAAP